MGEGNLGRRKVRECMAFLVTPSSGGWHLVGSLIYWLGLLFCAFAAGCVIVTATAPSTKGKSKPSLPPLFPPTYIPEVQRQGRATIWIGLPILAIIAGTAGYGIRDHQLNVNSHTYWDVSILERYSDSSFRIKPARMQDGQWDFCSPAPFQKSDELRYITFEQKNGCKRLEYFQKLDARLGEKLNAAISLR